MYLYPSLSQFRYYIWHQIDLQNLVNVSDGISLESMQLIDIMIIVCTLINHD